MDLYNFIYRMKLLLVCSNIVFLIFDLIIKPLLGVQVKPLLLILLIVNWYIMLKYNDVWWELWDKWRGR